MSDEIYVNKRGFKCVATQLAKTEGRDPQEYERAKMISEDEDELETNLKKMRVVETKYDTVGTK